MWARLRVRPEQVQPPGPAQLPQREPRKTNLLVQAQAFVRRP